MAGETPRSAPKGRGLAGHEPGGPAANGRGPSGGDSGGPALVIGFGNPLRGDDGVGFAAAGLLAGLLRTDPHDGPPVEALACQQLTFDLAEAISRADLVVFIDADRSVPAGEFSEHEAGEDPAPPPVSHHLTPPALMAVTRAVYGSAPRGIVLSVGAVAFDSPRLSPAVGAVLPRVVEVARAIAEARGTRGPGGTEGPR